MTNKKILIISGPGLAGLNDFDGNSFGEIMPGQIKRACLAKSADLGLSADFRQTDDENEMFLWIDKDSKNFDALIINPVANSHAASLNFEAYRSTIRLIAQLKKPLIEVYLGNIFLPGSKIASPLLVPEAEPGFVCGLGLHGYLLAIQAIAVRLNMQQ